MTRDRLKPLTFALLYLLSSENRRARRDRGSVERVASESKRRMRVRRWMRKADALDGSVTPVDKENPDGSDQSGTE